MSTKEAEQILESLDSISDNKDSKDFREILGKIEEELDVKESKDFNTKKVIKFLLEQSIYFFYDQDKIGYAKIKINGNNHIYKIASRDFTNYMTSLVWKKFNNALSKNMIEAVARTLEAKATFESKEYKLHIRTAWHEGSLWYDLGSSKAVKINKNGWKIIHNPPILFKRFAHQIKQLDPVEGGTIDDIINFVNLNCKNNSYVKTLFLSYLVTSLIPDVARAILIVHGQHGSAKSTFFKIIKRLLDPSQLDIMTCPKNQTEIIQMLSHHYLVLFDNLSELKDWQSDTLCRACTGLAFSKRRLYTDDEDQVYKYKRALGFNGINLVATKADLLDRSLIFELDSIPEIKKMSEQELLNKFDEAKPKILGAIFSLLAKAIAIKESGFEMPKKPRMADYATWCSAVTIAMGDSVEDFLKAYEINISNQNSEAIEASAIALTVIHYMKNNNELFGTSQKVYDGLQSSATELGLLTDSSYPKSNRWLWKKIKLIKPNLQSLGIEFEYNDKDRPRTIKIVNTKVSQKINGNNADNDEAIDIKDMKHSF